MSGKDRMDTCLSMTGPVPLSPAKSLNGHTGQCANAMPALVGMPVKDTIKLVNREGMIESSPDRSMVWQAQTPQVFSVPLIVEAFTRQMREDCTGITDDAMVVEAQMGGEGAYGNGQLWPILRLRR